MEFVSVEERERATAIVALEKALAKRLFSSEMAKIPLRLELAILYQYQHRYADAEIAARAGLDALRHVKNRADTLVIEAELTRALSEAMEAQGRAVEAEAIRSRVDALLMSGNQTPAWHQAQAVSLERQGKYVEAASHYISAEKKLPPKAPATLRAHLLTEAAGIIHAGGKYWESLELSLRALAIHDGNATQIAAYRQASVAAMAVDKLDDATAYQEKSREAALRTKNPSLIAAADAQMGHLWLIKGDPDIALEWAEKAAKLPGSHHRMIRAVRYESYMAKKMYEDALKAAQTRNPGEKHSLTYQNKITDAGYAMAAAPAYIALKQYDKALEVLDVADKGLGQDEQVAGIIASLRIWAKAHLTPDSLELRAEARELLAHFHRLAEKRGGEYIAQRSALCTIAEAAFLMGDDEAALEMWDAYKTSLPRPGGWSDFHYHRGESLRRLNRFSEARTEFALSVSFNDDEEPAEKSRARLTELAAEPPPDSSAEGMTSSNQAA